MRRCHLSTRQKERSHQKPTLTVSRSWAFSLQNCAKIRFCCSGHPVCGTLFRPPEQTNVGDHTQPEQHFWNPNLILLFFYLKPFMVYHFFHKKQSQMLTLACHTHNICPHSVFLHSPAHGAATLTFPLLGLSSSFHTQGLHRCCSLCLDSSHSPS